MLNKVKQRWQLYYKVAQCTTFFIKIAHFDLMCFLDMEQITIKIVQNCNHFS